MEEITNDFASFCSYNHINCLCVWVFDRYEQSLELGGGERIEEEAFVGNFVA